MTYTPPNCRACGLIWTREPDDICLTCKRLKVPPGTIARARAMRALGLPHQWAPNTRASRRRLARLLLDTFPPGTITGL